ncbi:bactofilin family protein [Xenorhabdus szentirmaii]|uniref:Ybca protein transcriptional activator n=3 Tax=Xenorhabdus szentirmaii TaxID=290112 RepID=W1IZ33_9GAMM|nr:MULTISPECIES: polymer-forming cytoskeletal protein [Xenorhabdus]MBD2779864.1 polymer-forming cytoskeletal protein [Xenorhabdus sp. 38]MBD2793504.1 polymer-forming cytoskeletal protein [Xenorhabdus sp. CUL]MBD2800229.1 polymer-forming cytoskeletal protein [Xenorhabdus sp. M]MBD2819880.1 polymer-forming cytoskeletal protein [Xenorhabdus sp. 42]PHM30859.1 membrane protein [Xenorhabdus szentirmaii DSM 16338]
MKKYRFSDNAFLYSIWILWGITLGLYLYDYHLSCAVTATLSFLSLAFYFTNMKLRMKAMFGKKTEAPAANSIASIVPAQSEEKKVLSAEARPNTVIAKNSVFKGDIEMEGDIQVWGKIIGNIRVKGGAIRIMHAGKVEGELNAPEIIIDGHVEGTCCAETLDILEHGELRGVSRCGSMSIRRGGLFVGQSEQVENKKKPEAERVVPIKDNQGDKLKTKSSV